MESTQTQKPFVGGQAPTTVTVLEKPVQAPSISGIKDTVDFPKMEISFERLTGAKTDIVISTRDLQSLKESGVPCFIKFNPTNAEARVNFPGLSKQDVQKSLLNFNDYSRIFKSSIIYSEILTQESLETLHERKDPERPKKALLPENYQGFKIPEGSIAVLLKAQKFGVETGYYVLIHTPLPNNGGMNYYLVTPVKNLAHCSGLIQLDERDDSRGVVVNYNIQLSTGWQIADATGRTFVVGNDLTKIAECYYEESIRIIKEGL